MHKPMPPLHSLIAFEAAVRHASFKVAAKELHITPGAVSQQVKKLEEWLGYALFTRQIRQLEVTERGMQYFSRISPALEQICAASEVNRTHQSDSVYLSLPQTLAAKWLSPRLSGFMSQYPDIEVHINASNKQIDFKQDNVDIALRHFDGVDSKLETLRVLDDEIRLFCTPSYLANLNINNENEIVKATLIVNTLHHCWDEWLNHFTNISQDARKKIPKIHFDQTLLAIDAAKHGQGMVLSNTVLVEKELAQQDLIEPFGHMLSNDKNFYLVHPKQRVLSSAAKILKAWLLEQFEK